jgi:hypothetical protein
MLKLPNQSSRFWGPNKESQATSFEAKSGKTVATDFEAKPGETVATGFEVKLGEIILVVLRLNHWQPVELDFEAQPRNPRSSYPCARCRPHTVSLNLPIIQPLSTRPMFDYPRSSAPGLLLLPRSSPLSAMSHLSPTHHETSKRDSPHEQR